MQMIEKDLTGAIVTKHLFLQRPLRPVSKGRILHFQYALVKEGHHGKECKLVGLARIPHGLGLFHGCLERGANAGAKVLRIGRSLLLQRVQSENNRQSVLIAGGETVSARSRLHKLLSDKDHEAHECPDKSATQLRPVTKQKGLDRKSLRAYLKPLRAIGKF